MTNNFLELYSENQYAFPIHAHMLDFSKRIAPSNEEIRWLLNTGYSPFPHALRRCIGVTPTEKILFDEICYTLGNDLSSSVTNSYLAEVLGMNKDTVASNLDKLMVKQFIEIGKFGTRQFFVPKDLSKNAYLIMSETTHRIRKYFKVVNVPKKLCKDGVIKTIEIITKGEEYLGFIKEIDSASDSEITVLLDSYFDFVFQAVRERVKVEIFIE
ncbi:hypothetical protein [Paenibacillus sp. B2(2019)]|uniref:hypothetical protein n=1 Tax=Paenibacillus sp. B2(2019) TaxID=2607754 RepID=UPI0011F3394F|nr:hypothetical protein [Paenibacillus sp. B2(2019)]KAA1179698.1 hypothetical protein PAENI_28230 [Paenibacillus sp. B2(2019)]